MDKSRFNYLFERYFDKTATASECDELMGYVENGVSDEELTVQLNRMYMMQMQGHNKLPDLDLAKLSAQQSAAIISRILKPAEPAKGTSTIRRRLKLWQPVAAAALVVLLSGVAWWHFKVKEPSQSMEAKQLAHFKPGGNKAILTLADGTKIDLDEVKDGEIVNSKGIKISKSNDGKLIYEVLVAEAKHSENDFNSISTPRGGQYQVKLPDGTQVWLNASSTLRYPVRFAPNERKIELDGEGYFEVMKNPAAPFRVMTRNQQIKVLGTHFNVNSYHDEVDVLTTVLEGSVQVRPAVPGKISGGQAEVLKINQQAVMNVKSGQLKVKEVLATSAIAWKVGKFQFQQTAIGDVMRQLSRWYDVDFRYEGKLPDVQLSGEIKRNVDAAEALEILKFFDLKYTVENGQHHKKVIVIR